MDGFDSFKVLINAEGQYSLWPLELDIPAGWEQTGPTGTREECVAYIDENWTDIAPISGRLEGNADA